MFKFQDLNELSGDKYPELPQAAQRIAEKIYAELRQKRRFEDTRFAGQHSIVLNVSEAHLIEAYKDAVASTFSPRAIYYRRRRGYRDQDVNMSVACIVMIDAAVGGVMYTVDPNDSRHAVILISAVWMKKYQPAVLEEKLDLIGRLLGSVRLLDMHLEDDRQVDWYAGQFMQGNYQFAPEAADG
jgi:hypothetical protein